MSDLKLTDEERDLIAARRAQKAAKESERIEMEKLPDISSMTSTEYYKLSEEQKSRLMAAAFRAATSKE